MTEDLATAAKHLLDAMDALERVAGLLRSQLHSLPYNAPEELLMVRIQRATAHLKDAAADMPTEAFLALVNDHVNKGEAIRERVKSVIDVQCGKVA